MSSISQNQDNRNEIFNFTEKFIHEFHIGKLLFKCNAGKAKGIPVMDIFRYLLCPAFSDRSDYMQRRTGTSECTFSKNTMYRFRSKKTELLANVFDHCSMKFKRGYRMLTLGWSDGNSFVPVDYCLLSAADDKNLLCGASPCDGRSLAGKRRGRSRYLLSIDVTIQKDGETLSVRIVYVRNKSNRKDWLALISTDMDISEEEIIRIYGKHWDIEVFFKSCKSYLRLVKECRRRIFGPCKYLCDFSIHLLLLPLLPFSFTVIPKKGPNYNIPLASLRIKKGATNILVASFLPLQQRR